MKIGSWNGAGGLYGTRAQVHEARRLIRRALKGKASRFGSWTIEAPPGASRFAKLTNAISGWNLDSYAGGAQAGLRLDERHTYRPSAFQHLLAQTNGATRRNESGPRRLRPPVVQSGGAQRWPTCSKADRPGYRIGAAPRFRACNLADDDHGPDAGLYYFPGIRPRHARRRRARHGLLSRSAGKPGRRDTTLTG